MVGRREEIRILREAASDTEPQFIAVYGRRRVGKTYLVRETLGPGFAFSHVGMASGSMAEQLLHFRDSLVRCGLGECPPIATWREAFLALERLLSMKKGRRIVFLDELPWMDTPKSRFVPELEHFWNDWCAAQKRLVLVVCGSASSWIVSKIVRNRGGLHNRITRQIRLAPFTLCECEDYLAGRGISLTRKDICELYMALGGVPWYWSLLGKGRSVSQCMDDLFFAEGAPLKTEYDQLFASLFRRSEIHRRIVTALAAVGIGADRDTLLFRTRQPDSGTLSRCLEELEQCGFVRKYTPFGKKTKGALYQLVDALTLFHFRFLAGESNPDERFWTRSAQSASQNVWRGLAFERVCLAHVRQIKRALQIGGILVRVASWRHVPDEVHPQGAQIDLLLERADRVIDICEMKWCGGEYTIDKDGEKTLRTKLETFRSVSGTRHAVHLVMVTPAGVIRNAHSGVVQAEVTLDDLFARSM